MAKYQPPEVMWAYDKIQFARLIAEAEAAGLLEDDPDNKPSRLREMLDSMDLDQGQLDELLGRAQEFWDTYREKELRVLASPLTVAEAKAIAGDDAMIQGVVAVELSTFVDNDLEGVLDALGKSLVDGGELLAGISYEVVGQQGNTLYVLVSGDASGIFECHDDDEDDEDKLRAIRVEYDMAYSGGDYNACGLVAYVPTADIVAEGDKAYDDLVCEAFRRLTGVDPIHIVNYSGEEIEVDATRCERCGRPIPDAIIVGADAYHGPECPARSRKAT